ncbi:MAG: phosphomannomutase, partial [Rhodobacteraceae bacterium]|nr:phosphomannomutase [Paracoccaceae bacterium]
DRLADYPTDRAALLVAALRDDRARLGAFLSGIGTEAGRDLTDGLRLRLTGGEVVHLRPSGNAPELRCYAEAANPARAAALVRACL